MEHLDPNILATILYYVPEASVNALPVAIRNITENISLVKRDALYYKQRTELLLGKYLNVGAYWTTKDWKKVYEDLQEIINKKDPVMVAVKKRK